MMTILQSLIHALREELQQYGEMLALLDQQHDPARLRAPHDVLAAVAAVNATSASLQLSRRNRQVIQRRLAHALGLTLDTPAPQIIPLLPVQYQPLLNALFHENNELIARVRQVTREKQSLLHHSVELLHRLLANLDSTEALSHCPLSTDEDDTRFTQAVA